MMGIRDWIGAIGHGLAQGDTPWMEYKRRKAMDEAYSGIVNEAARATPPGTITDIEQTEVTPARPPLLNAQQYGIFSQLPSEVGMPALLSAMGVGSMEGAEKFGMAPTIFLDDEDNPFAVQFGNRGSIKYHRNLEDGRLMGPYENAYRTESGRQTVRDIHEPSRAGRVRERELNAELGGKPAVESATTEARARAADRAKAKTGLAALRDNTTTALDLIRNLKTHPGLEIATGRTANLPHTLTDIYDLDRRDFESKAGQIQGQVFLQVFENLKGGGAIQLQESENARAAISRLQNPNVTKEAYVDALSDLEKILQKGLRRMERKAGAKPKGSGRMYTAPNGATFYHSQVVETARNRKKTVEQVIKELGLE